MTKLREQITDIIADNTGNISFGYVHETLEVYRRDILLPTTDQILNLLKEELDKLTVIEDEEIHKYYLYIEDPFIPRYLDTGKQTAQAQLNHTIKQLKEALSDAPEPKNKGVK